MGNHIELAACKTADCYRASDYELVRLCQQGKVVKQISTGAIHLLQETVVAEEEGQIRLVSKLRNEAGKHYTNLLNLVHFDSQLDKAFCSSTVRVAALFEYSETSLETEIKTRQKKRIAFSEPDVQSILIMLVDAMNEIRLEKVRILPRNILVLQDKTLRLVNPLLDFSDDLTRETFFPPQVLAAEGRPGNREKEVSWEIGLTMLSVMALKNCLDLYKIDELEQDSIERLLGKCSKQYSEALLSLIQSTLWFDPESRISFRELQRLARDYNDEPETIPAITISRLENMSQLQTPTLNNDSFSQPSFVEAPRPSITNLRKSSQIKTAIIAPNPQNSLHHHSTNENILADYVAPNFTSPLQLKPATNEISNSKVSVLSEANSVNPRIRSTVFDRQSVNSSTSIRSVRNSQMLVPRTHEAAMQSSALSKAEMLMQSHGKLTYPNGSYYEGNLRDQQAEGFGVLYSKPNCPLYQGFWRGGKFDGDGILYNTHPQQLNKSFDFSDFAKLGRCWLYYRGTFKGGLKQGQGTIFLSNGEYFTGRFAADLVEGPGEYHSLGGEAVASHWCNNVIVPTSQSIDNIPLP